MVVPNFLHALRRVWTVYQNDGAAALRYRAIGRVRMILGVPRPSQRAYLDAKAATDAAFDRDHAVDTGGVQYLAGLTISGANARYGNIHIAVTPAEFDLAMSMAEPNLGALAGVTFVDLGSGKGRALLLAAERGYGRIVGVEFAAELDAIARNNVASRPDASRFTLVHADAAAYDLPAGPVLLYLYNSFDAPIVREVARRAIANWRADERPIRVVYVNPRCGSEWEHAGWRECTSVAGCAIYAPPLINELQHDHDAGTD